MRARIIALLLVAACGSSAAPTASMRPADWPAGADVLTIADRGQFVELGSHAVVGKVTVFDFYAAWCRPCGKVTAHLRTVASEHADVAVRGLDVVDWSSPLARHYLAEVPTLPYVVVYDRNGRYRGEVTGLDLAKLDALIAADPPS